MTTPEEEIDQLRDDFATLVEGMEIIEPNAHMGAFISLDLLPVIRRLSPEALALIKQHREETGG